MYRCLVLSLLVACNASTPEVEVATVEEPVAEPVIEPVVDAVPVANPVIAAVAQDPPPKVDVGRVATFKLGYGETLDDYARWSGQPVEDIASASGLSLHGGYRVGTVVKVPVKDDASEAKLAATRESSNVARVSRWVDHHGGTGATTSHVVHTGETASSIAKSESRMPIWVLAAYNPDTNLDRLKPGQHLLVPELVVEAPTTVAATPPVVDTSQVAASLDTDAK